MKPPDCPQLARQLATWQHMYRHLTSRDLKRIRATHWCQECGDGWSPSPQLGRDPEWPTRKGAE